MSAWYEDYDNIIGLASWLDSELSYFTTVSHCIRFFEKPWKWGREFELYLWWGEEASAEIRERIVEALDEETTAEDLRAELEEKNVN